MIILDHSTSQHPPVLPSPASAFTIIPSVADSPLLRHPSLSPSISLFQSPFFVSGVWIGLILEKKQDDCNSNFHSYVLDTHKNTEEFSS